MPLRGVGVGRLMANAILNFHFDYLHTSLNDSAWLSFVICFSRQTGQRQSTSPPCLGAACVWIWRWQVRVRQIRNSTVCIWCAIVHCSMRISALCDETAADGLSTPLGSVQSTLPDSQGSQPGNGLEDVGHIGQFRKWKWYSSQTQSKCVFWFYKELIFFAK